MGATPQGMGSTLVVCARVQPGKDAAFAQWRTKWEAAVLQSPGAESVECLQPTPDQVETVCVARFDTVDALRTWRHGELNAALIEEGRPLADGGLLMQLTGQAALEFYAQHGATEVVISQIKPGREEEYKAFARRIEAAQQQFPGYLGSFTQPPHYKETGWTTVMRFDSVPHLNAWMSSPQRAVLLEEGAELIDRFDAQRIDTSFPGWVPANPATGKPPNMWKTAALVLLTLYPVVMLEIRFLMPHLATLPGPIATFVGNAISVALTTWPLMPLAIRVFRPWLFPEDQPRPLVLAMPFVVAAAYLVEIALFSKI